MDSDVGKLFIGGISWETTEEKLVNYFKTFGDVVQAVIMKDRATGRARGFGFIVFADPSVADRIVQEKHMIDGKMVEAKKAVPREEQSLLRVNNGGLSPPNQSKAKKIFVGGLAAAATENDLRKYFQQFGEIADVVVMYDHGTQRPRGFGFITYASEDAVDLVLQNSFHELNQKMVEVKRAIPKDLSQGLSRINGGGVTPGMCKPSPYYAGGYSRGNSPSPSYGSRGDGPHSVSPVGVFPHYVGSGYAGSGSFNASINSGYGPNSYGGSDPFGGNGLSCTRSFGSMYGAGRAGYTCNNVLNGYAGTTPGRNLWSVQASDYLGGGESSVNPGTGSGKLGEFGRLRTWDSAQNSSNSSTTSLGSHVSTDIGQGSVNGERGIDYGNTIGNKYRSSLGKYGLTGDTLFSGGDAFDDDFEDIYGVLGFVKATHQSPKYDAFGYDLLGGSSLFAFGDHDRGYASARQADRGVVA